jgi:type I restriction enzyme R subunit
MIDVILPGKEADPYIADFKQLSKIRQLIRTYYEGVGQSLRIEGKKVQRLIDDHIRSLEIAELMNPKEVTYNNFLIYAAKFKERARTALIKNKARQIIRELAPTNPVYYEKLRERLEKIIEQEERRRKDDANYFSQTEYNQIVDVYNEALSAEEERQKLGFSTQFEFAVYEQLQALKNDEKTSKDITNAIYSKVKEESGIIGWKSKRSSEKRMSIAIYDILSENKYPEDKTNELTMQIIDLAKRDL